MPEERFDEVSGRAQLGRGEEQVDAGLYDRLAWHVGSIDHAGGGEEWSGSLLAACVCRGCRSDGYGAQRRSTGKT